MHQYRIGSEKPGLVHLYISPIKNIVVHFDLKKMQTFYGQNYEKSYVKPEYSPHQGKSCLFLLFCKGWHTGIYYAVN